MNVGESRSAENILLDILPAIIIRNQAGRRLCDYSIYDIGTRKNYPERNNIMAEMNFLRSVPYLLSVPSKKIWADYDDEADVLYVSFHKPQQANDSIMEDNVIRHYRDKMLVGMTILGASRLKE